jgi:transcriptional regulator with XRE-family HTH domain
MAQTTDGARLLRGYFDHPRMTQSELARRLGVSSQAVWMWVHGRAKPSHRHCVAIETLTGVPANAWLADAESDDSEPRSGTDG